MKNGIVKNIEADHFISDFLNLNTITVRIDFKNAAGLYLKLYVDWDSIESFGFDLKKKYNINDPDEYIKLAIQIGMDIATALSKLSKEELTKKVNRFTETDEASHITMEMVDKAKPFGIEKGGWGAIPFYVKKDFWA